jgi:hypothetical protein
MLKLSYICFYCFIPPVNHGQHLLFRHSDHTVWMLIDLDQLYVQYEMRSSAKSVKSKRGVHTTCWRVKAEKSRSVATQFVSQHCRHPLSLVTKGSCKFHINNCPLTFSSFNFIWRITIYELCIGLTDAVPSHNMSPSADKTVKSTKVAQPPAVVTAGDLCRGTSTGIFNGICDPTGHRSFRTEHYTANASRTERNSV